MDKNTAQTVVKVFAVLYWIEALFALIAALASLFGSAFVGTFVPTEGIFACLLAIIGVFMSVVGVLGIFVGYGLWKHRNWARITAIVLAVLSLFIFPIGIVFVVLVIYFFGFNNDVKSLFK